MNKRQTKINPMEEVEEAAIANASNMIHEV